MTRQRRRDPPPWGRGTRIGESPLTMTVGPPPPDPLPASLRTVFLDGGCLISPGLLYLHGDPSRDPIVDYMFETGIQLRLGRIELPAPCFRGMGTDCRGVDWDRSLLVVPQEQYGPLHAWLGTVRFLDPARGDMRDVRSQFVPIVDQPALSRLVTLPDPLPTAMVVVYCLRGAKACHFVRTDRPRPYPVASLPGWPETAAMRDAVLGGRSDPYAIVEGPATRPEPPAGSKPPELV